MSRRSKENTRPGKTGAGLSSAPALPAGEIPGAERSHSLESKSRPAGLDDRRAVPAVCLVLAAMTWLVFGQTLGHEFVNYDDGSYIFENVTVQKGLTWDGIHWAFTHVHSDNWHPLTTLTHMLDCGRYGLNAGGHHLTNVLLHTATAILLFLVLRRMTGFLWRSAFVAAVFAIHPLRVESVAWVSERKDVLSGVFFMLTVWAYARYAQCVTGDKWPAFAALRRGERVTGTAASDCARAPSRATSHVSPFYCLVLLFLGLGLMSKPMLVTLPFVLLLLDYWPLRRFSLSATGDTGAEPGSGRKMAWRLAKEKIPLITLSAASCLVTMLAQKEVIKPVQDFPLPLRLENALVSYMVYLRQMFHPVDLAVFYPYPKSGLPVWEVAWAGVALATISAGVVLLRRKQPWLITGWFWYVGMLVPVIGVIQVGNQGHADRYTYLPQIGLYLLLTWAAADFCAGWRHRRLVLGGGSTIILMALIFCARTQASYWRNSESLWTHALACTQDNYVAHNDLGDALFRKGRTDEAIPQFQKALEIKPDYAEACNHLGNVLLQQGQTEKAIAQFQKTLEIKPDYAEACNNLGNALLQQGRLNEATAHFQKALEIEPDYVEAHNNLGLALLQQGRMAEAITHYQKALDIKPDYPEIQNNLAWVLATCPQASLRNGNQAVELAIRANQLTGNKNPLLLRTLAAADAEAGRFSEAVETAQRALQLAEAQSNTALADVIRSELKLFQAGVPFHLH
jgi:Flp pilus assembly protein TadD